jgi:hypothetical protein
MAARMASGVASSARMKKLLSQSVLVVLAWKPESSLATAAAVELTWLAMA